ncbi:glycoside hydrolase family 28 protein [Mangrovibacterium lignilyticum]|uniref:glycoside hydrolase family 28 protein n=1 Tax=Mangrovibacterium lignilyticum TaxID=2668052 RepID=UPI0013D7D2FF|nr:glycoside hydrolase family 28 protein [Mangrovibacterium lignilyticum]
MKKQFLYFTGSLLLAALVACQPQATVKQVATPIADLHLPFDMPEVQVPVFPADTFSVLDFGAVPNDHSLCTEAINTAIQKCSEAGGGVVLIPAGLWVTGPIYMQSNVNLHTANGAYIQFTADLDQYKLIDSFFEGLNEIRCESPIMGRDLENIAITGQGIFDGDGSKWRQVKKEKLTASQWKGFVNSGGIVVDDRKWYPSEASMIGNEQKDKLPKEWTIENMEPYKRYLRPVMVSLVNCKKLLLEGVTFQNSPAWNVNPLMCEHVTLRNLSIRNPWFSQNGDGLDLESCRIGLIENCSFDVGDDAICIKSGKDEQGRERGKPTELFVIRDCVVYHGHGGFVLGSEMSGGVRNLYAKNLTFIGTDCGLRFKSNRGRGGVVENIWMEDIRMSHIPTEAIRFNLFYAGKSATEDPLTGDLLIDAEPVTEKTPAFRNMYFKNIYCDGAKSALMIQGIPEMPVENLKFENMLIKSDQGISINYATNVEFKNVELDVKKGIGARLSNSKQMTFEGFKSSGADLLFRIGGTTTENVKLNMAGRELTDADVEILGDLKDEVHLKN